MRALPLGLVLLAACFGKTRSPFVRIEAADGRVYYADTNKTIHSETGGFLTFRDLVTKEHVRLKNGTYEARECPRSEVEVRQLEYLDDPSKPPVASDYGG